MTKLETLTTHDITLAGVPEGQDALVLADLARAPQMGEDARILIHVARDDRRLEALEAGLAFFAGKIRVIALPAWDTVPYDRVGPRPDILARRITALSKLVLLSRKEPTIVLTTVNAVLQRLPPRAFVKDGIRQLTPQSRLDMGRLVEHLMLAGFTRSSTVLEPGDVAQRGGILDFFPPGRANPVRLDFFGDQLETIKTFDPETQLSQKPLPRLVLMPVSEVAFGADALKRFRERYLEQFGGNLAEDPLYQAVSAGQRYPGLEHWLPFFHETLETLFDYCPGAEVSFDHRADGAIPERLAQITEHYKARAEGLEAKRFGAAPYKPVRPETMFIDGASWARNLNDKVIRRFSPFTAKASDNVQVFASKSGRSFAPERSGEGGDLFDAVVSHTRTLLGERKRVLFAATSEGSRERLLSLLADHGLKDVRKVASYTEALGLPGGLPAIGIVNIEAGFVTPDLAIIADQDILGDRLVRAKRKQKRASAVITEATSLGVGDLVVHADHGIGRFEGLRTITALGAPHDCLELVYAGGDKLYLPVENIELLSRFGSDSEGAELDRLGGAAWQSRKARLKKRLREIAGELIKIAALRQLKEAPVLTPPSGAYDEFVARFPYEETEDQDASIEAVLGDLASGKPMDRLVCGDVGFGKTEVALRAAYVTAMAGLQVAIVVPTTLLSRQHYRTVTQRFEGLPVRIAQTSRLVAPKDLAATKEGLKSGQIDIVVGTHALLGKGIEFQRLGLLVIDEEQHFGVAHKERLKQVREDVHVLTLSATPIPRTLQLAMSGVRDLSLITTPPIDRLAVRTYISPFDPVILRDALRRERFRGGQTYYVCPRIVDLDDVAEFLREAVPELKVARAHGQLGPTELEDIMSAFYDGRYDVLLSTAIVESGLDVPNANTMIVHRADMFGLAQLYQLRGRVGRSKTRAYAYMTTPEGKRLTDQAEKRLKVLGTLDTLGAGFSLAHHDLDLRGGGNLLGEEQSGHIKEVGFELYQTMLEEAIQALKVGGEAGEESEQWSPQIGLGTAVLIPEPYVADLQVRLGLYRRLSTMETREDIDQFASELIDRFGPLPPEVKALLDVMEIKSLCRQAGIANIDAGPKGVVLSFRKNTFAAPEGLVKMISRSAGAMRVQPDHKLLVKADLALPEPRLKYVRGLVQELARIAAQATATARIKPAHDKKSGR